MRIINGKDVIGKYMRQLAGIERTYHPNLRESAQEKRQLYSKPGSRMLLLMNRETVIAEQSGLTLSDITEKELREKIPQFELYAPEGSLYIHSFTVRTEFRNQGFGTKLAEEFLRRAKEDGYKQIFTHARQGASSNIYHKLGGELIKTFHNYYNTGESYDLQRIVLGEK